MRTADVIEQLRDIGDYRFSGDQESEIEGVRLGRTPGKAKHQYSAVIDDEWEGPTPTRIREQQSDLTAWVQSALASGVTGFITSHANAGHPAFEGQNTFSGPSAQDAFYRVAEVLRDSRGLSRVAAITGSSGKTTTKRMLAHALRAAITKGRVRTSPRSFNISTEVAKHLSRSPQVRHSVIEIAGSAFEDFNANGFAVSADVAIVTSIAEAHLETFGSLEGVAQHKAHIFNRPPAAGTAIINLDAPYSEILVRHATEQGSQLVTYGQSLDASLRLLDYDHESGEVTAWVGGETIKYVLGARGVHMALNSLAVIAALRSYRLPHWRRGVDSLADFVALDGRGASHELSLPEGGYVALVDESYNANPGSMRVTLKAAGEDPELQAGRVVLVLGDMLELGPRSAEFHAALAPEVQESTAEVVHLYGDEMLHLHQALNSEGIASRHWKDLDELHSAVTTDLRDGDTVVVKASNGTGLGKLVERLKVVMT